MPNGTNINVMKPYFDKLENLESELKIYQEKTNVLTRKKNEFKEFIEETQGFSSKLMIMGIAGIAAIFFDFFVNSQTLSWIPAAFQKNNEDLKYLFSLIFLVIDVAFAILASGLLAKDKPSFFKERKIWGTMLWSMAVLKTILFFYYTQYYQSISIDNPLQFKLLILAFIVFVYAILHLGGAGLFYIIKSFYFWILMEIFYNPEDKIKQIRKQNVLIDNTCSMYELAPKEVRANFLKQTRENEE